MSTNRIKELLAELATELRRTDDLDADTRRQLADLGDKLESLEEEEETSLSDNARELQSQFAASHPTAARIAREIADLLANMGI
jgi:uncharacterized protein involved in exopolysaccharide biosynthesis